MEIHVFNDTSMTRSAKLIDQELRSQANVTGAWEAYAALKPWAYRADLWRLMILWGEGGIYLDGKIQLKAPLESWASLAPHQTASLCLDNKDFWKPTSRNKNKAPIYYNAIISAKKRSPILLRGIQLIIDNVRNRKYPGLKDGIPKGSYLGGLAISGPIVLGLAATSPEIPRNSYRVNLKLYSVTKGVLPHPIKKGSAAPQPQPLLGVEKGERKKVHSTGSKWYSDLFKQRKVYCDPNNNEDIQDPNCNVEALLE